MSYYMNANAPMSRFEASKSPLVQPDGHVLILVQPSAGKTGVMVLDAAGNADAQYGWTGSDAGYHPVVSNLPGSGAMMAGDPAGKPLIAGVGGRGRAGRGSALLDRPPRGLCRLVPERLLDTRPRLVSATALRTSRSGKHPVVLQVAGVGKSNIPADAAAAVLNLTGTEPTQMDSSPCGRAARPGRPPPTSTSSVARRRRTW